MTPETFSIPLAAQFGGLILLFSGILLLTPGLLTDIIGFVCLLPQFREHIANGLLRQALQRHSEKGREGSVIVEGEFWEDNEQKRLGD